MQPDVNSPLWPMKRKNLIELMGITAYQSPFVRNNSASRLQMYIMQTSQACVLEQSDVPRIMTGMEKQIGDYANKVVVPADCEVIKRIPKYRATANRSSEASEYPYNNHLSKPRHRTLR